MEETKVTKLNLGCGLCKLDGYLNVDIDAELKPDAIVDLTKPFPFEKEQFEEVLFFHTIEHISKSFHPQMLSEIHRVLKPEGKVFIGYPEFSVCAKFWLDNKRGKRDFWEACIYGRQTSAADFHVALMDSAELKDMLLSLGFDNIIYKAEEHNEQYTLLTAVKGTPRITYEEHVKEVVFG